VIQVLALAPGTLLTIGIIVAFGFAAYAVYYVFIRKD
jgi:hypothetical protein